MTEALGGKSVYGACLGILMLEARFPRIPGDMGNAKTWPFPVQYRVVRGADPDLVVRHNPMALLPDFITAARDLVESGCDGLTTNCGFLSLMQRELTDAVPVPVATSSLLQIPNVQRMLPKHQRVGVITISAGTLTDAHFAAVGVGEPSKLAVVGMPHDGSFVSSILGNEVSLNYESCRSEMIESARRLVSESPDVGAIVLECTNMVPYAADIRREVGRPVYSIYSLALQFQAALEPCRFPVTLDDPRAT